MWKEAEKEIQPRLVSFMQAQGLANIRNLLVEALHFCVSPMRRYKACLSIGIL
jgi:hypothetical protein